MKNENSLLLDFNIKEVRLHPELNRAKYYKFCFEYISLWFSLFKKPIEISKEDVSIYFIRNKKKKSWYDKENKIIYLDIDNLDRFIYEYGKFVLYSNKFLNVENSPNLKNIYSKFLKDSSKYKYFESIEFEEFFADIFEHYVVIDNIKNQISDFVSCRYLKVQEDYLNKNEIPYFNNENKINSFFNAHIKASY